MDSRKGVVRSAVCSRINSGWTVESSGPEGLAWEYQEAATELNPQGLHGPRINPNTLAPKTPCDLASAHLSNLLHPPPPSDTASEPSHLCTQTALVLPIRVADYPTFRSPLKCHFFRGLVWSHLTVHLHCL